MENGGERRNNGGEEPFVDYYAALGVPRDATRDEIRIAFRRLAMELHPDRTGGDKVKEERFKAVGNAYAVLGDEQRRGPYDQRYARENPTRARAAGPRPEPAQEQPAEQPASKEKEGSAFSSRSPFGESNSDPRAETPFGQYKSSIFEDPTQHAQNGEPRMKSAEAAAKVKERLSEQTKFWAKYADEKPKSQWPQGKEAAPDPVVREINGLQYLCDPTGARILSEGYTSVFKRGDHWFGGSVHGNARFGDADTAHGEGMQMLDAKTGKTKTRMYSNLFEDGGRMVGSRTGQEYMVNPQTGKETSEGYDRIEWVSSPHMENGRRVDEGFLIGRRGNEQCLLDPRTGKRLSTMFNRITKKDRNLMIGERDGKEHMLDPRTGKMVSHAYDSISRSKRDRVSGYRDDVRETDVRGAQKERFALHREWDKPKEDQNPHPEKKAEKEKRKPFSFFGRGRKRPGGAGGRGRNTRGRQRPH